MSAEFSDKLRANFAMTIRQQVTLLEAAFNANKTLTETVEVLTEELDRVKEQLADKTKETIVLNDALKAKDELARKTEESKRMVA